MYSIFNSVSEKWKLYCAVRTPGVDLLIDQ